MPTVRMGPIIGLIFQVVLLAMLAATVGLGAAGWVTGVTCGLITYALLSHGLRAHGSQLHAFGFGAANGVTLARATLVGCVAALTADSFQRPAPVAAMVAIAAVALALDAVDGQVARRTGTASSLGARFDMEVDAFLLLVLSLYVARSMGAWVLAIGAMRYAFVVAMWALPWISGPLPVRFWRRVVAAIQGVALVFAAAEVAPAALGIAVVAGALALLAESFGRDIAWRWQHSAPARPRIAHSRSHGTQLALTGSRHNIPDRA